MKKIIFFIIVTLALGGAVYYSGVDLSFLGLRSAILSADNCNASLLQSNKAEYEKSTTDLIVLNSYIAANNCDTVGTSNTLNNFQVSSCQRKINLKKNKTDFVNGYTACQESINAGPRVLSASVLTDSGSTSRALLEQDEKEDMHLNEKVYKVDFLAQDVSYIRELRYEMTLSATNSTPDINVPKIELKSNRSGSYACSQAPLENQTDVTKKIYTITCRAVGDGYKTFINNDGKMSVYLDLSVSTILSSGQGNIKFLGGKFSTTPTNTERDISRIANVENGTISYAMAYVDTRDLTLELIAQDETSSTTIPVKAVFNKLINNASVSKSDFVLSGGVTLVNLLCNNATDNDNSLRTICVADLKVTNTKNPTTITVKFPAGKAQDKTRGTPKDNLDATPKIIKYEFATPKIFVGAPCASESHSCSGVDNTPQLIAKAGIGDITARTSVSLYDNDSCSGAPIQTILTTRDMPKVDLYDPSPLSKNQVKTYTVQVGSTCSSLNTTEDRKATYTYSGETIAPVNRLACMSNTTFGNETFAVGPFVENELTLCDAGDMVDAKKCNAWQGNGTFNPECLTTGQGTLNNPYRICTPEQLQEIDNLPGKHFRLGKNIDLSRSSSWFGGKGFEPIGRKLHFGFYGSLDGNGYEISNLSIKSPDNYTGLFGVANGASWPGFWVNNLRLNNVHIQDSDAISGSLVGMTGCAIISGVESIGVDISGAKNNTGGLIGQTYLETKVLYSKTSGQITTSDTMGIWSSGSGNIGGLIGQVPGSIFEAGFNETNVNLAAKGANIAGLIGHMYGSANNYLEVHDNLVQGSIFAEDGSGIIGAVLGNASGVRAKNNTAEPASDENQIFVMGEGTVGSIGGFVGQAGNSDFSNNKTSYSIQGNSAGTVGGFGGRIDTSIVSKNIASGKIGGENGTGPQSFYIGGFVGYTNGGSYTDNYSTTKISTSYIAPAWHIGGFVGIGGAVSMKRNYSSGTITSKNKNDYQLGGFAGSLTESNGLPYSVSDNFSTSGIIFEHGGLNDTLPSYVGGFVGFIPHRVAGMNNIFENNYYANSNKGCAGSTPTSEQPSCTKVDQSALYSANHPVYTGTGDAWDFVGTWWIQNNALPLLKPSATVGS